MKIGIVVQELNISGGTQRQALELALNLQKMGHRVIVFCVYFDRDRCYPELTKYLDVRYLSCSSCKNPFLKITQNSFAKVALKLFIHWIALYRNIILLKKIVSKKLDVLCFHDCGVNDMAVKYKILTGNPTVWQMNDLPQIKTYARDFRGKLLLLIAYIRGEIIHRNYLGLLSNIDRIVVIDYYNKNRLKAALGYNSKVIRNGVDLQKFRFSERVLEGKKLKIFSNGIFFPWRRFEDLVEALRIIKGKGVAFEAHHIGTDLRCAWYAEKIYAMVDKYGLSDSITFHGHASDSMLIDMYSTSDIFVFPNSPQTWGLAVFEAMACGTPTVLTTGCGASEVLTDGENALIVRPESPDEIASAIIRLKGKSDLWQKLSRNGRLFVENNIRWDLYAENMLKVFKELTYNKTCL